MCSTRGTSGSSSPPAPGRATARRGARPPRTRRSRARSSGRTAGARGRPGGRGAGGGQRRRGDLRGRRRGHDRARASRRRARRSSTEAPQARSIATCMRATVTRPWRRADEYIRRHGARPDPRGNARGGRTSQARAAAPRASPAPPPGTDAPGLQGRRHFREALRGDGDRRDSGVQAPLAFGWGAGRGRRTWRRS